MSKYLDRPVRSEEEVVDDIRDGQIRQMKAIINRVSRLGVEMEKLMKLKD